MERTERRLAGMTVMAVLAALIAFPVSAAATTNGPIADTGGMTATLPLLGTTLTVDVTLDTAGNISGVTLAPPGDFTQTTTEATRVRFENTAGTTTVSVKARGDRMSLSAKAPTLADLSGTGGWSADVFGTGAKSTVAYTVGNDGSGKPTVSIGTISPAAGVTATAITMKNDEHDEGDVASAGVAFGHDGFVKRLTITVQASRDEHREARLRITLSGRDRQRLTGTLAELTGARTWSALLCDGTPVSVAYHVGPGAAAVFDSTTGAPATHAAIKNGFEVRFTGTNVGLQVALDQNKDGTYTVAAKGSSGSCGSNGHAGPDGTARPGNQGGNGPSGNGSNSGSGGRR